MWNETVRITHPCHPLTGMDLAVIHHRPSTRPPSVVVEHPDGTLQAVPLSWTDRALPGEQQAAAEAGRLSGPALVELVELLDGWEEEGG